MNENEKLVSDRDKILDVTHAFYKKLWGEKDQNLSEKLQNDYATIIKESAISNDEVKEQENFVFEKKIEISLNQLNKESSPGSDRLTTEFYKTFFYLIKSDLVEIYYNCFLQKEMSKTMKQAIIKLIFKKNDKMQLKNWCPILLLNTDYKIPRKLLANRITLIMNNIISTNQKRGLPKS